MGNRKTSSSSAHNAAASTHTRRRRRRKKHAKFESSIVRLRHVYSVLSESDGETTPIAHTLYRAAQLHNVGPSQSIVQKKRALPFLYGSEYVLVFFVVGQNTKPPVTPPTPTGDRANRRPSTDHVATNRTCANDTRRNEHGDGVATTGATAKKHISDIPFDQK